MNKFIMISLVLYSLCSLAKNCNEEVNQRHASMLSYYDQAVLKIKNKNSLSFDHSRYNDLLFQYFRVHPDDLKLIKKIETNILVVHSRLQKKNIQYSCRNENIEKLYCIDSHVIAMVPPLKNRVVLCPLFFKKSTYKQEATLLHELFHLLGGWNIDYLDEHYCHKIKSSSKEKLVRAPDSYMLFILKLSGQKDDAYCF